MNTKNSVDFKIKSLGTSPDYLVFSNNVDKSGVLFTFKRKDGHIYFAVCLEYESVWKVIKWLHSDMSLPVEVRKTTSSLTGETTIEDMCLELNEASFSSKLIVKLERSYRRSDIATSYVKSFYLNEFKSAFLEIYKNFCNR